MFDQESVLDACEDEELINAGLDEHYYKLKDNELNDANFYYDSIKDFPILSKEKMDELVVKAQNKDMSARDDLICSNYRLCFFLAKRYANLGVPFMDLVQEGATALIKAVDNFDISKGVKFSTYATICIRGQIYRAVNQQSRDVRVPEHVYADYRIVQNCEDGLAKKLGRIPTLNELSKASGFSVQRIEKLKLTVKDALSISTCINDDDDTTLGDMIADESDNNFVKVENESIIDDALNLLDERERYVICCFGGYKGYPKMTTAEIGGSFKLDKISATRVHQIKRRAINKLRLEGKNDFIQLFENKRK